MTRSERSAPSLFSSSLVQRGVAPTGILEELSGEGSEGRGGVRKRVAVTGFRMVAVLVALALAGYLLWPSRVVEAPRVTQDLRRSAHPPTAPDSHSRASESESESESEVPADVDSVPAPARIVVDEAADPPAPPTSVTTAPRGPERRMSATPTPTKPAAVTPMQATSKPIENSVPAQTARRSEIVGEDRDVQLLAALMVHAGASVPADDAPRRALRECGALAPVDREACVAALCLRRPAPAAICKAPAGTR